MTERSPVEGREPGHDRAATGLDPLRGVTVSERVAAIPKADLHLHAEAGPRIDRIVNGENGVDWADWKRRLMSDYPPGMDRLNQLAKILDVAELDARPEMFQARVRDVLKDSAEGGAIYAEVRFGRETVLRPDFMERFRMAEAQVAAEHPGFVAEPLVTVVAKGDPDYVDGLLQRCVEVAPEGLAGVDLIPDPYNEEADWNDLRGWCDRLASAGLGLTVHAGEFSTANLAAALSAPGVTRIGHGVHVADRPDLVEAVVKRDVALEICITSNVVLGAVDSYEDHPIKRLLDYSIDLSINTDDPIHFQTGIGQEYEIAHRLGLSEVDLRRITESAIRHSFTTDDRRARLLKSV